MKFLQSMKAKVLGLLGLFAVGATNAMAAITVDTTTAVADLGIAFGAILAIAVLVFGYHKITGLFSGR